MIGVAKELCINQAAQQGKIAAILTDTQIKEFIECVLAILSYESDFHRYVIKDHPDDPFDIQYAFQKIVPLFR